MNKIKNALQLALYIVTLRTYSPKGQRGKLFEIQLFELQTLVLICVFVRREVIDRFAGEHYVSFYPQAELPHPVLYERNNKTDLSHSVKCHPFRDSYRESMFRFSIIAQYCIHSTTCRASVTCVIPLMDMNIDFSFLIRFSC